MPRAIFVGRVELGPYPRIVAAGGEDELPALATATADILELRADLFAAPTPERIAAALRTLRSSGRPLLLTVRAATEGGRAIEEPRRQAIYEHCLDLVDAIDLELSSAALRAAIVPHARAAGKTVLLSFHDFAATPPLEALRAVATQAFAAGADVAKLVTTATQMGDLQTLLTLTLELRERGVATLAMGSSGTMSRVFFPAAGSWLTYGSVGAPTAPGQLPVAELAELVRRFYPTGD